MFPITSGATQGYLAELEQTQKQLQQVQSQMSSGVRVQQASDDPSAVTEILQVQAQLGQAQQIQSNLSGVQAELGSADAALQSAVQAVESAISLGTEGATSTSTPEHRAALAQQIAALQETLVSLSRTSVNGRYIFSGDQDSQPSYALDPAQASGVRQLVTASATRRIMDVNGTPIEIARTAQEIFDARNADGTPAAANVFAAIQSLVSSLQNNDQAGIATALDRLHSGDLHLNGQLAFFGTAENRITNAVDLAQRFQTEQKAHLGRLRDADIPTLAIQLNQEQVQQQASLSVESSLLQAKNLFSYIA
jgi:flagellar hook-associated protein 3 FlgL